MRGQVGPSSKILSSLKAVTDFMKERDEEVIVGFFENESDKLLEQYLEANNDIRDDYAFAHTFDPAAKKYFGIKGSSVVLFHPERFRSKFEDKQILFKVRISHRNARFFYQKMSLKDVRAHRFCASLQRTQIHMPRRHASSAHAKY